MKTEKPHWWLCPRGLRAVQADKINSFLKEFLEKSSSKDGKEDLMVCYEKMAALPAYFCKARVREALVCKTRCSFQANSVYN